MNIEFQPKQIEADAMFNMREISVEALGKAADRLRATKDDPPAVVHHNESGPFDYYIVLSNGKTYEVTRMGFFAECTCDGFQKGKQICKHVAASLPPICRTCYKRDAPTLGGQCDTCGPGKVLAPQTKFQLPKYYNKRSVFEVVEVSGDRVICHDLTEPVSAKCPFRTPVPFDLASLDLYRREGSLQIVEKEMSLDI